MCLTCDACCYIRRQKELTLTFREFLKETEELLALVYALLQYNTIFNIRKLRRIKQLISTATGFRSVHDRGFDATTRVSS
jgi:hypothetical protein